ncbi:MAG: glycosyltransferase family 4 protein [Candidatus Fimenecus sp.]
MSAKTILILVNKQTTVINFRLEVVQALVQAGYTVYVSVPEGDRLKEIEAVGAHIVKTEVARHGTNPVQDFALMLRYVKLIRTIKPQLVLTYTIKPNIYGGMACSVTGTPYIANITGLGTAVENGGMLQKLTVFLYRVGLRKAKKVFFQNAENRRFFETRRIALGRHDSLPGSGVNLEKFRLLDYPETDTVEFAFISRIMREKGIEEYLETAKYITEKYPNTRFHVCGFGEQDYEDRMQQLDREGLIVYHGLLTDVRVMLKDAHCVIHPTFYPEGMSNVLLESAASGRPIISTDRFGCREAIDDGVNGFIIRERDSRDLIEKTERFLSLSFEERKQMGIRGREKVAREFDRNIVVQKYLDAAAAYIR